MSEPRLTPAQWQIVKDALYAAKDVYVADAGQARECGETRISEQFLRQAEAADDLWLLLEGTL